ncbi:hypothetical protein NBRC111894_4172 [Sporolactobacillus inulinus]|uniref:Uncharacterized protein n=1 Tax=Sporolactobacillus inulinus TaxID=2078 RepID=A0A4Y1ZJL0_9BACL|nr:hypothetical protein NBRC111894_4172 [Sporolactobacillus inulinus]
MRLISFPVNPFPYHSQNMQPVGVAQHAILAIKINSSLYTS